MSYTYRSVAQEEIDHHIATIEKQGFSIMENAIPEALLQDLLAELEYLEQLRPGGDIPPGPFTGRVTRRWFDVMNDGDVWIDACTHPAILPVLEGILGDGFLLSTVGAALIGPGEPAQPIHCDDQPYGFARPHQHIVCNTMWALSEFTDANGATRIIPGSHLTPDVPDMEGGSTYDSIPVEMACGSIAIFVGSAWHGGGSNKTDDIRQGLTVNYCSGSVRQQENYMLAIHPERLLSFPPELQDMLGFKLRNNHHGHIFAGDPRAELERRYTANREAGRGDRSRRNVAYEEYLASSDASK